MVEVNNHIKKLSLVLAILLIGYFGLLLQKVPFEQINALTRGWYTATQTPWTTLAGNLFSPRSEEFEVDSSRVLKVRVTESIFEKVIHLFWGESMAALEFYNIGVATVFFLCVFWFGIFLSRNVTLSFLNVLFLATTPAYVWCVVEYGDYSPTDQLFLLGYLFYFFVVIRKYFYESTPFRWPDALRLIFWWALGMISMRVKEPNVYLVPGLTWGCFLLDLMGRRFQIATFKLKAIPLFLGLALLTVPVLWVHNRTAFPPLSFGSPFYLFFFNPWGWEPEKVSALFTFKQNIPVTIVAHLGAPLCWLFVGLGIFLFIRELKMRHAISFSLSKVKISAFLLFWVLLSLSFFVGYYSYIYIRYLTWTLLPLSFLLIYLFAKFMANVSFRGKNIIVILFAVSLLFRIIDNTQHAIFIRQELLNTWIPKWEFMDAVFQDMQGHKPSLFELYLFWNKGEGEANKNFFQVQPPADPEAINEKLQSANFKDLLRQYGRGYFASKQPMEFPKPFRATLLKELKMKNYTWLHTLKGMFTKKKPKQYYLYRINPV